MDDHGRHWKISPAEDEAADIGLAQQTFAEQLISHRLQAAADRIAALQYLAAEFTHQLGIRTDPKLLERNLPRMDDLAAPQSVGPTAKPH